MRTPARRDEDGAVLLLVALLAIVIFACAALAVDISSLAMERQRLHDHVDAAAHAGAYELPEGGAAAVTEALNMARANDPEMDPDVELYCIVASTGQSRQVKSDQIPSTCSPGTAPYNSGHYPGLRCNASICAIPCNPAEGDRCNSVRVVDSKVVDHAFAPVIGIDRSSTGAVASTACKGSCGEEIPNPMDVVILADRTPSMEDDDREDMKDAILDSLDTMNPAMHYVAFGTIHKSKTNGFNTTCRTEDTTPAQAASGGTWLPLEFSNDYRIMGASPRRNDSSDLVRGIDCLPGSTRGGFGTHLAAPLKAAVRYLTGRSPNNLSHLPTRPGEVTKLVVLETDGRPEETIVGGYSGLESSSDMGTDYRQSGAGQVGCDNFTKIAEEAKQDEVVIMTIGFGKANEFTCNRNGTGDKVRDVLAQAASPNPTTGSPSTASDCGSPAGRAAENGDGDYFYCAATGADLKDLFKVALIQATTSIRLVEMP